MILTGPQEAENTATKFESTYVAEALPSVVEPSTNIP